jgi:hypothetical protein
VGAGGWAPCAWADVAAWHMQPHARDVLLFLPRRCGGKTKTAGRSGDLPAMGGDGDVGAGCGRSTASRRASRGGSAATSRPQQCFPAIFLHGRPWSGSDGGVLRRFWATWRDALGREKHGKQNGTEGREEGPGRRQSIRHRWGDHQRWRPRRRTADRGAQRRAQRELWR